MTINSKTRHLNSESMKIRPIATIQATDVREFKLNYYRPNIPVVIKGLAEEWPAYSAWDWDYFKDLIGQVPIGIYNNTKSDAYTPVNQADEYVSFSEYIDMIRAGDSKWRIFLFNLFSHAPQLVKDFVWPEQLMNGFVKRYPMLFAGGSGAITHMHFDMDLSHILHTQFWGLKRVLLYPNDQQRLLYRKPFEVMTLVDFSGYHSWGGLENFEKFPAIKLAQGYEVMLERGDTLFLPSGYWHHMEYLESGFAMSLRAFHPSLKVRTKGVSNLLFMRNIDTLMKLSAPAWWHNVKVHRANQLAENEISRFHSLEATERHMR